MIADDVDIVDLAAVSILEYSMKYWSNIPERSQVFDFYKESDNTKKRKVNWWAVGFADFTGAGSGSALGPGGALAGGILNSAVTASVAALSS